MTDRIPGFTGEYLWELDIAEQQLTQLAGAIPAERYGWRPADGTRSVSGVLVHIAAGNFGLLDMIGIELPKQFYPLIQGQGADRFIALVLKNQALENTVTAKADVTRMLAASFAAVRAAFSAATAEQLDVPGMFFGERTTVRRVYLRLLTHTHEHMGQIITYVRAMGMKAPWPDPMEWVKAQVARAAGNQA